MNEAFVVDIEVDTLVVNDYVYGRNAFRQRKFEYAVIEKYSSPEPLAFDRNLNYIKQGVYLQWAFPRSMRTSYNDDYPLLPNRWLVTRICHKNKGLTKSWVIESDCPVTDILPGPEYNERIKQASPYMISQEIAGRWKSSGDPYREKAAAYKVADIGMSFSPENWSERSKASGFITAVAPGNPEFTGYIGFNRNIFSFYDALGGIDNETITYSVIGWYSLDQDDILADHATADSRLAELRWQVEDDAPHAGAKGSFYTGAAYAVEWRRDKPLEDDPLHRVAETKKINVSVGTNTHDAFCAFVGQYVSDDFADRFAALIHCGTPDIDNTAGGGTLFRDALHHAGFSSKTTGTVWDIVTVSGNDKGISEYEAKWLAELNQNQYLLDRASEKLRSLQWELNAAWWKQGKIKTIYPNKTGYTAANFDQCFDTKNPGSLISMTIAQAQTVATLAKLVPGIAGISGGATLGRSGSRPCATPEERLKEEVEKFARSKNLESGKELRAAPAPRFWKPTCPTALVAGVNGPADFNADRTYIVRLLSRAQKGGTPVSGLDNLPEAVRTLLQECYAIDSRAPEYGEDVVKWSQPWAPMYLEWKVKYFHVPLFNDKGVPNWEFDGFDYSLSSKAEFGYPPIEISGVAPLSAHSKERLADRLKELALTIDDHDMRFTKAIGEIDGWELLTQELYGFNEYLAQRDTRAYRTPIREKQLSGDAQAKLCGYSQENPIGAVPYITTERISKFDFIRGGQFYFTELSLYDKFGRMLTVVSSGDNPGVYQAKNFPVIHTYELEPEKNLLPEIAFPIQLPPRVLQYARLDMELVDSRDASAVCGRKADANPVCGWIVPNHLNHSLALYAADGTGLGQLAVFQKSAQQRVVRWTPPPNGNITTLDDVAQAAPHIEAYIRALVKKDEEGFTEIMRVTDDSLWTMDPFGDSDLNLTVLTGRPLVLLRFRLSLTTDGETVRETDWGATFSRKNPGFYEYPFQIRLGDRDVRKDGLVGYFEEDHYDIFHSTAVPEKRRPDILEIAPGNYLELSFAGGGRTVSMLADPRGQIHAYTGVLPVKTFDIPQQYVKNTLSHIESEFRIGPFVTRVTMSPEREEGEVQPPTFSVQVPELAVQDGKWSWFEPVEGIWKEYGILPPAYDENRVLSIREGILQFVKDYTSEHKT